MAARQIRLPRPGPSELLRRSRRASRDAHPKARPFAGTYDHLYLDIYPPSLQAAQTSQAADQFLNAAAGARCGAGIAIQSHELTVDSARDAARQLLDDPAFRGAAERVSEEIQAMPAPDAVVDEIEHRFGHDRDP